MLISLCGFSTLIWSKNKEQLGLPDLCHPLIFSLSYKMSKQLHSICYFSVFVSFFSKDFCYWTRTKMACWAAETWGSYITRRCLWSTVLHHFSSQFHHHYLISIFFFLCKKGKHSNVYHVMWDNKIIFLVMKFGVVKLVLLICSCHHDLKTHRGSWCKPSVSCNMFFTANYGKNEV